MSIFLYPEIDRGWDLINDGKRDEALELINIIEKREKNTPEEKFRDQIIIANLIFYSGELKRALKTADEIIYVVGYNSSGNFVSWKKWKPTEPIRKAKYIEEPFQIEARTGREARQKIIEVYKQWEWVPGTFEVDY